VEYRHAARKYPGLNNRLDTATRPHGWSLAEQRVYAPAVDERERNIYLPYESRDSNGLVGGSPIRCQSGEYRCPVGPATPICCHGRSTFPCLPHPIFSRYAPHYVFLRFRRCDQFYKRETEGRASAAGDGGGVAGKRDSGRVASERDGWTRMERRAEADR